jgi:hypothetical protein
MFIKFCFNPSKVIINREMNDKAHFYHSLISYLCTLKPTLMKTLFSIIILSTLSLGVFAQAQTTAGNVNTAKAKPSTILVNTPVYRCPICGFQSAKPGDCAKDKIGLVKVGDYYCPECYMTSAKAGKCAMCGVDMKKMEASAAPVKTTK